jgi:hypothetical protein
VRRAKSERVLLASDRRRRSSDSHLRRVGPLRTPQRLGICQGDAQRVGRARLDGTGPIEAVVHCCHLTRQTCVLLTIHPLAVV